MSDGAVGFYVVVKKVEFSSYSRDPHTTQNGINIWERRLRNLTTGTCGTDTCLGLTCSNLPGRKPCRAGLGVWGS